MTTPNNTKSSVLLCEPSLLKIHQALGKEQQTESLFILIAVWWLSPLTCLLMLLPTTTTAYCSSICKRVIEQCVQWRLALWADKEASETEPTGPHSDEIWGSGVQINWQDLHHQRSQPPPLPLIVSDPHPTLDSTTYCWRLIAWLLFWIYQKF